MLVVGFAAFLVRGTFAVRTKAELDYGEGIVLWQAAHVTALSTAYHRVDVYPYIVFHYPPLYHLASRGMALITGDLLAAGRLVSLLSLAGACLILAWLTWFCLPPKVDRVSRWIGTASAGLLVFTLPVWRWAVLMRVDTLAMLFSFAGIALFILARRRPALVYGAFLLFVAAIFTKQVMVAAPAACFVLLLIDSPKRALRAAIVTLVAGLVPLLLLQTATHGLFLRNIVSYNKNPFLVGRLIGMWGEHLSDTIVVLASALSLPAVFLYHRPLRISLLVRRIRGLLRRNPFGRAIVVITAVLLFAVVVTVTCGKVGSNYNYFFEVDLAAALAGGLFLGWLMHDRKQRPVNAYTQFALFVTVLFALHSLRTIGPFRQGIGDLGTGGRDYSKQMVKLLSAMPGPVYSENMVLLMQAGKEVPAEPAIITVLAEAGQWNESGFVQSLAEGHFAAIVVHTDLTNRLHFSPAVARAIDQRYESRRSVGPFKIYEPRPAP